MSTIVIRDLDENAELDNAAMRQIIGGRASPGLGVLHAKPKTLLDRRTIEGDSVLPRIGLGGGFLGSEPAL